MIGESFLTRDLMRCALLLRDLPARHRPLALFVSELDDDEFWGEMHKLDLRETAQAAAAAEAVAVKTIPNLKLVQS